MTRLGQALALNFYRAATALAEPLLRRKLARRAVAEPGYAEAVEERFGHYLQPAEANATLIWIHAVSLGETRTAAILLREWRKLQPGLRVLLTHGTATGRAEGRNLLEPGDIQVWQPWDSPDAVERFLSHFKPRIGVLLETEVWPVLMAGAARRSVPMVLANARLSAKSQRQAWRLAWLSRPAYGALAAVYAQTEADAERFRSLGANVSAVAGNLKFDASPDASQQALGRQWRARLTKPVLMLASSREGEEALLVREVSALRSPADGLPAHLLIVPRHPQRFDAVEALLQQQGWRVSRRSSWRGGPAQDDAAMQADVWLGDSLGEMTLYYSLSRMALLGGSFEPLGGQNLIEAAACACPVVMGPHTFNFAEAAQRAEAEGAALRAQSMADALAKVQDLLDAPAQLDRAASAGLEFARRHRGAAFRTAAALNSVVHS
jgi:3-deoxy-D-manno-octulosonic-acid transferase